MCLICFLKESFQYTLRNSAQMRTDRFEHTLCRYKDSFITEFKENKSELCESHNNDQNKEIVRVLSDIDIKVIGEFFEKLVGIYVCWINSELTASTEAFIKLLSDYKLLDFYETIDDLVLFRGRRSKEFISHWDMFHIPFNKRFRIGNQRYSLVGQPLLYLGTSPYCVYRELQSSENLRISSFRLKEKKRIKIFNNSNIFYKYIRDNNDYSTLSTTTKMIKDDIDNNKYDNVKTVFFLAILASCCSFERRNELKYSTFCEEYVLPQILAQIIKEDKNCKFRGIMYTSTKAYCDKNVEGDEALTNSIYKNICIFTNYNKDKVKEVTYVYDRELYEEFILSSPLIFGLGVEERYYNIKRSLELIKDLSSDNYNLGEEEIIYGINNILASYSDKYAADNNKGLTKTSFKIYNGKNIVISRENLEESNDFTKSIELHCLLLRNIILNIKEKIKEA